MRATRPGVTGHHLSDVHRSVAGRRNRWPHAGAHSGQQRSAVCRALFRDVHGHRQTVDVGLDLPPQLRTRATTAQPDGSHRHLHLFQDFESVPQGKRYAFQDRSHHVRPSVLRGDAHQCAARQRIQMRSSLTHQVRRP